jgi:hypothetical protein
MFVFVFLCFVVEAFATVRSLVQRSSTKCPNRLRNLRCEAAKVLNKDCRGTDDDDDQITSDHEVWGVRSI